MSIWNFLSGSKKHEDREKSELVHQGDVFSAMIATMAAVAYADGNVDNSEIAKMVHIYGRVTGSKVSADRVMSQVETALASKAPIEETLSAAKGNLEPTDKANIIHAGVMIAVANDVYEPAEEALLKRAAEAMDMGPKAFKDIVKRAKKQAK